MDTPGEARKKAKILSQLQVVQIMCDAKTPEDVVFADALAQEYLRLHPGSGGVHRADESLQMLKEAFEIRGLLPLA